MKTMADLTYAARRNLELTHHREYANPCFIPLNLTGGIGDVIMAMDAVHMLARDYQIVAYCDHINVFKYFCKDPKIPVFKHMDELTWKMEFNTIAKFHTQNCFSGFAVPAHKELFLRQQEIFKKHPKLERLVQYDFDYYFLIAEYAKTRGWNRRDFPMRCLGYEQEITFELWPSARSGNYITVHDGFDTNHHGVISGRSNKQWNSIYWSQLVQMIKSHYPDIEIVQLGGSTSTLIKGVDRCLVDETTITEAFDMISNSRLHIDGDSGLVHAATRLGVPCVVLWGSTPLDFYGYPQNANLVNSPCPGPCYGITKSWMNKCVMGYGGPLCMDEIKPESVFAAVEFLLSG